jgi:hypothetical protein
MRNNSYSQEAKKEDWLSFLPTSIISVYLIEHKY